MRYIVFFALVFLILLIIFFLKTYQVPSKLRKAEEFLEKGEFSKASEIVKQILEKKKDHVPARFLRALILMNQKQYLLSISEFNNILATPDFSKFVKELDIHYHLAELYNATQNWQKEIEEYRNILAFNPEDIKANHRLGHALYQRKKYKQAKDNLLRAIVLDPTLKDIHLPLGISCFEVSDYSKAEEYLLKSTETAGDHSEAYFYLGMIYRMKKDYDNAVNMLETAKKNNAFWMKSLYALGEIAFEREQFAEAIDHLEKGLNKIRNDEDGLRYRYLLAECYELQNKIDEAVHHWEKIESESPNYRSTKIKLDSYRDILANKSLMSIFTSSLEELQPLIVDIITGLNYNIVNREKISQNEFQYKAYNIKRINDPPLLIFFNRTTREITEGQILDLYKRVADEKCKSGIYITTARFSIRAKTVASSKMIDLYDSEFVSHAIEKIRTRRRKEK